MYNIINQQIIPNRARSSGGRRAYYDNPGSSVVKFYSSSQIPIEKQRETTQVNEEKTEKQGFLTKIVSAMSNQFNEDQTLENMKKIRHGLNILV